MVKSITADVSSFEGDLTVKLSIVLEKYLFLVPKLAKCKPNSGWQANQADIHLHSFTKNAPVDTSSLWIKSYMKVDSWTHVPPGLISRVLSFINFIRMVCNQDWAIESTSFRN